MKCCDHKFYHKRENWTWITKLMVKSYDSIKKWSDNGRTTFVLSVAAQLSFVDGSSFTSQLEHSFHFASGNTAFVCQWQHSVHCQWKHEWKLCCNWSNSSWQHHIIFKSFWKTEPRGGGLWTNFFSSIIFLVKLSNKFIDWLSHSYLTWISAA